MTETLEKALAPLLTIGLFYNLGMLEYPRGQLRPYLSYLYILAIFSFLTYFYYYQICYLEYLRTKQIIISPFLSLLAIMLILISFCRFKELKMCLRELAIVDDTLEAFGAPKEYQKLRNWIIRIIIGWIAYVFYQLAYINLLVFFVLNYDINFTSFLSVTRVMFLKDYSLNVIVINTLISTAILGCISSRFHRINERLRILYSDLFENGTDYRRQNRSIFVHQRITGAKNRNQNIWVIMHVYLQLCLISRKLNGILKVQMLIQMIWYFCKAITVYLSMYHLFGDHWKIWTLDYTMIQLYIYFNFVLNSILFLTLNYLCQTVYFKENETVAILHILSIYNLDEDLHKQILQFILQIKQTKVKFGLGQYYFGYNFICKMYSTILSVTIIFATQVCNNRPYILAVMRKKFCLIMV